MPAVAGILVNNDQSINYCSSAVAVMVTDML